QCGHPKKQCACAQQKSLPKSDGIVRISRETKGRKGKGVTLVSGLPLNEANLQALAKQLKQRCGSGGTVKDGVIEIQGDHRSMLMAELTKQGYRVKQAGG
ncbi:MAG TPA: translation initiation factor Sui1, partial [Desulfurivibrionaceae bacterium]|nr:translation initiation factor Sui1 [Desulfurivibrionaceae bacterium]